VFFVRPIGIWGATGVPAYELVLVFGEVASMTFGTVVAIARLAAVVLLDDKRDDNPGDDGESSRP
jgi:hypothetical protein